MHLDVLREISGENLGHEEAIVEGASNVLDGVAQVERLDPFKDFAGETGGRRVRRGHLNSRCHLMCFGRDRNLNY